eukprot:NODE_26_length_35450_cov_0.398320.p32 type:complete len:101 gc:universal NODE_26_length_35450_cov_0.398320:30474-30776(+)
MLSDFDTVFNYTTILHPYSKFTITIRYASTTLFVILAFNQANISIIYFPIFYTFVPRTRDKVAIVDPACIPNNPRMSFYCHTAPVFGIKHMNASISSYRQ